MFVSTAIMLKHLEVKKGDEEEDLINELIVTVFVEQPQALPWSVNQPYPAKWT